MVDTTGTAQASYTYDPYGITTTNGTTLATSNPWRYTSGYQDTTGLYHLGARYYDPTLGRFTQPDPSGQSVGYVYAGNDPTDASDPTGQITTYYFKGPKVDVIYVFSGTRLTIQFENKSRDTALISVRSASLGAGYASGYDFVLEPLQTENIFIHLHGLGPVEFAFYAIGYDETSDTLLGQTGLAHYEHNFGFGL